MKNVTGAARLPRDAADVLRVPAAEMGDVIRGLLHERLLSPLVSRIHVDLGDSDPAARQRAQDALNHLGFVA